MPAKTILLIEDDPDIREELADVLDARGYHVLVAANGKAGLDLLATMESPCLILLDLMMPVMHGWEFLEAKAKTAALSEIPVVILSAFEHSARTLEKKVSAVLSN